MNNTIIVLQGPPASGKSTLARQLVEENKKNVIVNRDAIREARGEYWVPTQENYISDIEEFQVRSAIKHGLNPIIDATNLNPKTIQKWKDLAAELGCKIEFKHVYVPFAEALERDGKRDRPVGEKVLKRFYRDYYYNDYVNQVGTDHRIIRPPNLHSPNCVIVDLDGTLALHRCRLPYDWDLLGTDKIDPRLQTLLLELYNKNIEIIFITGRPEEAREGTVTWLKDTFYKTSKDFKLYMRKSKDFRSSDIIKKELWEKHVKPNYNTLCVFEDSNKCVKMYRSLGLLTCQVANGDY